MHFDWEMFFPEYVDSYNNVCPSITQLIFKFFKQIGTSVVYINMHASSNLFVEIQVDLTCFTEIRYVLHNIVDTFLFRLRLLISTAFLSIIWNSYTNSITYTLHVFFPLSFRGNWVGVPLLQTLGRFSSSKNFKRLFKLPGYQKLFFNWVSGTD